MCMKHIRKQTTRVQLLIETLQKTFKPDIELVNQFLVLIFKAELRDLDSLWFAGELEFSLIQC